MAGSLEGNTAMTDVMISYSRRDGDFVRRLHAGLQERGRDVWVDWQDIPLSADWWQEIAEAIEASNTFVFVVSPDSMGSPICNLEIAHARENNKRLIPILFRRTDLEDALDRLHERELSENTESVLEGRQMDEVARKNWNAVSRHNWLYFEDMNTFDESLDRLISVIETDLAHVKEHTRLLVRASEWDRRDQGASYLLTGDELHEAEDWLTTGMDKEPMPTTLHADFIGASRRAAEARQRRLLAGVTSALIVAVILTILSIFLAIYAEGQRRSAVQSEQVAEMQSEIAATSAAEANSLLWASYANQTLEIGDSPRALSLALASVDLEEPPALAQTTLSRVAFSPGPIARLEPEALNESVEVNDVAYSPTDNIAAVAMADPRVLIYDLEDGDVLQVYDNFEASVTDVAFTPNGEAVLASSFDTTVLLAVEDGQVLQTLEEADITVVNAIAVNPGGTHALTGTISNTITYWDLTTGQAVGTLNGHTEEISSLTFDRTGTLALSGSLDNTIRLWDLGTLESVQVFEEAFDVTSVAFNPFGATIVSGNELGELSIRNTSTGEIVRELGNEVAQHSLHIRSLAYSNGGRFLMSGSDDAQAIVWDVFNGRVVQVFDAHDSSVNGVAFSRDGRTTLTGSSDGTVYWWSVAEDSVSRVFSSSVHESEVLTVDYASGGLRAVSGDLDGRVVLWQVNNGRPVTTYEEVTGVPTDAVNTVTYLPDSNLFVTGSDDTALLLWDDEQVAATIAAIDDETHTDAISAVAVHG
ncbi:MAG: TIR domain-containing protein, partial [Chloroflexota bacterium]